MVNLTGASWRKSTRSAGNGGECVEVADNLPGIVAVRDSKDLEGPALTFPPPPGQASCARPTFPAEASVGVPGSPVTPTRRGGCARRPSSVNVRQ